MLSLVEFARGRGVVRRPDCERRDSGSLKNVS
jgi:hypothetical protein